MEFETLTVGPFQENCYVVRDGDRALVVDPGDEADRVLERVGDRSVEAIVLTHAHVDHVMALTEVREATGADVWLHPADRDLYDAAHQHARQLMAMEMEPLDPPDQELTAGTWNAGPFEAEVLHTPGHTPGGVSLHFADDRRVLVGDCLFARGIGRTDLGGDRATLLASIRDKLLELPDDTVVLPGHGPPTTIGQEARANPFLV